MTVDEVVVNHRNIITIFDNETALFAAVITGVALLITGSFHLINPPCFIVHTIGRILRINYIGVFRNRAFIEIDDNSNVATRIIINVCSYCKSIGFTCIEPTINPEVAITISPSVK